MVAIAQPAMKYFLTQYTDETWVQIGERIVRRIAVPRRLRRWMSQVRRRIAMNERSEGRIPGERVVVATAKCRANELREGRGKV